jgi:hypothetical protein
MVHYVGKKLDKEIGFNGARSLLLSSKNTVLIALDNISKDEDYAFSKGKVLCSMLYQNGMLFFVWKFLDKNDEPEIILPSYFRDIDGFPVELDKAKKDQPMKIGFELIETTTSTIKSLRIVEMPSNFATALLDKVSKSLKHEEPDHAQLNTWSKIPPPLLFLQGEVFSCTA